MTPQQFADKYLTPPVRKRYLWNLKQRDRMGINENLCGRENNELINWAFIWDQTPEGHSYWSDLNYKIVQGKVMEDIRDSQTGITTAYS